MGKSLVEAFSFPKATINDKNITDYEVFADKVLLEKLRSKIMDQVSLRKDEDLITIIDEVILGYDLTLAERNYLINLIKSEVLEFGPLTNLLNDLNVTEIMVNGPDQIYLEIDGKIVKDNSVSFIDNEHIMRTLKKLTNQKLDLSYPFIDTKLADGSSIFGVLPPVSSKGAVFTIHKVHSKNETMDDFIRIGSMTPYMAEFLSWAVKAHLNILICGRIGSGSSTLLSALSQFILDEERIIVLENTMELLVSKPHVIALQSKNFPLTKQKFSLKDLIVNVEKMRADRILIGEVSSDEIYDLLDLLNSGYEGCMMTMHACDASDAIERLRFIASKDMSEDIVPKMICNAIDLVVVIDKLSDGKRKITAINELNYSNGKINMQEIFSFKQKKILENNEVDGEYTLHNVRPKMLDKLHKLGVKDIDFMFKK